MAVEQRAQVGEESGSLVEEAAVTVQEHGSWRSRRKVGRQYILELCQQNSGILVALLISILVVCNAENLLFAPSCRANLFSAFSGGWWFFLTVAWSP